MKSIMFLSQFMTKPRMTGALLPSSQKLAEQITEQIDFQKAGCIVEYGPGTGVFTDRMLAKRRKDTLVILIEQNVRFWHLLREKYATESNLIIVNRSAEEIDSIMNEYGISQVDHVVSGLPFASLPEGVSRAILEKTRAILKTNGSFILFQYTRVKKPFIERYFEQIETKRVYRNFPPAYVFSCKNRLSEREGSSHG